MICYFDTEFGLFQREYLLAQIQTNSDTFAQVPKKADERGGGGGGLRHFFFSDLNIFASICRHIVQALFEASYITNLWQAKKKKMAMRY